MAASNSNSGRWKKAMIAGVGLLAASLGPWIYCGWTAEAMEGQSVAAMCLESHPLQFPTTIFAAGMMMVVVGMAMWIVDTVREREDEAEKKRLDRAVQRAANRQAHRTPHMSAKSMREGGGEAPEYIEAEGLDEESEEETTEVPRADDEDSVMAFLERETSREQGELGRELAESGRYVPKGLEGAAVFYVDGQAEPWEGADEARMGVEERAFRRLEPALNAALNWVIEEGQAVMVRVKPGVYQETITIPGGVSVVNDAMPGDLNVDQRLRWVRDQESVDHPQRVTLMSGGDEPVAIRFPAGEYQGLFGCHVVGRRGVSQRGVEAKGAHALAVINCVFEGFGSGGVRLEKCGEDLPGQKAQLVGCLWRDNHSSSGGGALAVEGGVVRVVGSILEGNRAPQGGAIWTKKCVKPLAIKRCLFRRNRAVEKASNKDDVAPWVRQVEGWRTRSGLGGAVYVGEGLAQVVDSIFEGNDGPVGGGAVAAVRARVVIKGSSRSRCSIQSNRGGFGGGVLAVGWGGETAMVKVEGGEWVRNLATKMGGAAAAIGDAVIGIKDGAVETNRAGRPRENVAHGGGLAAMWGGSVSIDGGVVEDNKATGDGGAVVVEQGSLKLDGAVQLMKNEAARGVGGAVAVMMDGARGLDGWLQQPGVEAPWKVRLVSARIGENVSQGPGGGVYVGHRGQTPALSVKLEVGRRDWVVSNTSREGASHGQNIWVIWGEELRASDEGTRPLEMVLG